MHAMQEVSGGESHHHGASSGQEGRVQQLEMVQEEEGNRLQDSLLTVLGMLGPLVTYLGPHHAH